MEATFTLSFSETQWICYNDSFRIVADSLEEIDAGIEKYFRDTNTNGTISIKMFFDFDRFPAWHRQYMPHYFNRSYSLHLS